MKILAAGDLHNDTLLARKLAEKAEKEKVELVILCGDITNFDKSSENLISPFLKKNKKVLFIPGNHESLATKDFFVEFYGIRDLHGYSVRYKNIGFFGCGGADIGPGTMLTDEETFKKLKEGFDRIKYLKKRIMVTHAHPSGSRMETLSQFIKGSKGVEKALNELKPNILLCSHVHEASGLEEKIGKTKVINVGREGRIINI